jgi:type IV pilus assembly protein PilW
MNVYMQSVVKVSRVKASPIRMNRSNGTGKQSGFSLLELMLSLGISAFIVLGVIKLYSASSSAFRGQEYMGTLTENGRAGAEIMSRTIRLARYWGCAGIEDASVSIHLSSVSSMRQGIAGIDGVSGAADEITVYHADDDVSASVLDIVDPGYIEPDLANPPDPLSTTAVIHVAPNSGFKNDDFVVLNDCIQGDVFKITAVAVNSGGVDKLGMAECASCSQEYRAVPSTLQKVKRTRFYIVNNNSGVPSLYMQENGGTAMELIEGVEDMQIYYGEDTDDDGNANRYVRPAVIAAACTADKNSQCWRGIASVRISLLLRTIKDAVTQSPQTYTFDGTSTTATDNYLRREYISVIALRNHRS